MNSKVTAIALSLVITSTSFAQVSQSYCQAIAQNENQQVQILNKIKQDFNSSSKLRTANRGVFAVSGGIMSVSSMADLIKDPSVMNAIGLLVNLGYTYWNAEQAVKENETGKNRVVTIDDLIAKRQHIAARAQTEQFCSAELMKASLADLIVERVQIQRAGLDTLTKLISAVKDQKSTSAMVMTGI